MINLKCTVVGCSIFLLMTITATTGSAETWTDTTGKFSIEAKFVRVEGKSVVLLKEDDTQLTVPIARLSDKSRALAKSKYDQMKRQENSSPEKLSGKQTEGSSNIGKSPSRAERSLNFAPPALSPAVSPMQPFPENMSLEKTVEYVAQQMVDGHPEVLWYMLPQEMRETFDDQRVRKVVGPSIDEQEMIISQIESLVFKAVEVLIKKKQFVLGSQMLADAPDEVKPLLEQGYDPAVGAVFELADLAFSIDLEKRSIQEIVDYHGPRIGSHLKSLSAVVPPEAIDGMIANLSIEMIDDNHGVIRVGEASETTEEDVEFESTEGIPFEPEFEGGEMVLVSGRWVPQDLYDSWSKMKEQLKSGTFERDFQEAEKARGDDAEGAAMIVGMFTGMAGNFLNSLAAATTQEEFDKAFSESQPMLSGGIFGGAEIEFGDDPNFGNGGLEMETGEPVAATGKVPEGWTLDLSEVKIPDEPAKAVAGGNEFKIGNASIRDGILNLSDTDKFVPDNSLIIFTFLDEDESIDGKKFDITPKTGFDSPHIHVKFKKSKEDGSASDIFMSKYAMRLEFGTANDGKIPGKIYLCLPDGARSIVRGTFEATIED